MKTFVQLKDDIGWAHITTNGDVPGVEVEEGTGDFYIGKEFKNGSWFDAELIKYASIDDDGSIIEIKQTRFPSEINGPLWNSTVPVGAKWVDGSWKVVTPDTEILNPEKKGE